MRVFLLLAVFAFSVIVAPAQNTITGVLPDAEVIIYRYDDLISKKKLVSARMRTDKSGRFSMKVPDVNQPLQIVAGNRALEFLVLQNGVYRITLNNDKLQVTDEVGIPVNDLLSCVNASLLREWYSLFVDSTTNEFYFDTYPYTIAHVFDNLLKRFIDSTNDPVVQSWIYYRFAVHKLSWLFNAEHRVGTLAAKELMDNFAKEYFSNQPVAFDNPYYLEALKLYLHSRMLIPTFMRTHGLPDDDSWGQIVAESAQFKDSLQQLALVQGIYSLRAYRYFGKDKAIIEKRIQDYESTLQYDFVKKIYHNLNDTQIAGKQ